MKVIFSDEYCSEEYCNKEAGAAEIFMQFVAYIS